MLRTASTSAEQVAFPFAAQAARLLYRTKGGKDEQVAMSEDIRIPALRLVKPKRPGGRGQTIVLSEKR